MPKKDTNSIDYETCMILIKINTEVSDILENLRKHKGTDQEGKLSRSDISKLKKIKKLSEL